jgi:hypothetical protein
VAQQLAAQIAASCAAIGVSVTPEQGGPPASAEGASTAWAGSVWAASAAQAGPPPPGWQMALELRRVPPYPSSVAGRYATAGSTNIDGYSSPGMNALIARIPTATPVELPGLYDQVDAQAWADFVDLPLVQLPVLVALNPHLLNVQAGPYFGDMAWDEQTWGFRSP